MVFQPVYPAYPIDPKYTQVAYDLSEIFTNLWKGYKASEVKSKVFWSKVSAPQSAQQICAEMIDQTKKRKDFKRVIKWRVAGGLNELYVDLPGNPILVGRVLDSGQSFAPAVGNVFSRLDNDKEFVLDGWGQNVPRYVYRSVSDTDVCEHQKR